MQQNKPTNIFDIEKHYLKAKSKLTYNSFRFEEKLCVNGVGGYYTIITNCHRI